MVYDKEKFRVYWAEYKAKPENAARIKERSDRHNRRRETEFRTWISELKESQPCMDCGIFWPAHVMQFDHVRGEKKFQLSNGHCKWNKDKTELYEEIAKCDLICSNCHHHRTHLRRKGLPLANLDLANQMLTKGLKGPMQSPGPMAPSPEEMGETAPDSEMGPGEPGGGQQLVDLIASIVMEILGGGGAPGGAPGGSAETVDAQPGGPGPSAMGANTAPPAKKPDMTRGIPPK